MIIAADVNNDEVLAFSLSFEDPLAEVLSGHSLGLKVRRRRIRCEPMRQLVRLDGVHCRRYWGKQIVLRKDGLSIDFETR